MQCVTHMGGGFETALDFLAAGSDYPNAVASAVGRWRGAPARTAEPHAVRLVPPPPMFAREGAAALHPKAVQWAEAERSVDGACDRKAAEVTSAAGAAGLVLGRTWAFGQRGERAPPRQGVPPAAGRGRLMSLWASRRGERWLGRHWVRHVSYLRVSRRLYGTAAARGGPQHRQRPPPPGVPPSPCLRTGGAPCRQGEADVTMGDICLYQHLVLIVLIRAGFQ
jgi:hypothetical protein